MTPSQPSCPLCEMTDLSRLKDLFECLTCGHEWEAQALQGEERGETRLVKDAHGTILADGDLIQMVKDKKLKGSSLVLKCGDKSRPIRLREGDHEIECKIKGVSLFLKAMYVKKVTK